jgi:ADP-heptose:LPS heptosyltransferase
MAKWNPVIDQQSRGLKVGLVWGGTGADPRRAISLRELAPFGEIPVVWFSLQTGNARTELNDAPFKLIDLGKDFADFSDTAAVMSMLDVIVTVDTASAHLAGALGRDTRTLLADAPDWRWGMSGDRTPWYPMMRLYRQHTAGDWSEAIARLGDDLLGLAGARGS